MGLGPIPWTAIIAYMDHHDIPYMLHSAMIVAIVAMDAAYLEWADKESKRRGNVQHSSKGGHERSKERNSLGSRRTHKG